MKDLKLNISASLDWESIHSGKLTELLTEVSDSESMELAETYCTHNYHPLPVNIVRGKGIFAYDGEGKEYLDCIGCYSALALGHNNPVIVSAVQKQLEKLSVTSRAMYATELGVFLKGLCEFTELDMACPMNSGTEAIETSLKLARKWAYKKKGVPKGKAEIIVAEGNFHGRTTTIIGFSSEDSYKEGFEPFTPGFKTVPYGDIGSLEKAITENTAGVLLEPIQAEGGIVIPPEGYLQNVRKICSKHNVLLILDEIQTGFCRTGKRFAHMHESATPDILAVGKALGGGVYPVSAAIGKKEVMEVFKPGDHGSTFGGNPLACAIGLVTMSEMIVNRLDERAEILGIKLISGFKNIQSDKIKEVRGRGLLIGLQVMSDVDSEKLTRYFLDEGILTKETRLNTFRFAPALIIEEEYIDEIISRVEKALSKI